MFGDQYPQEGEEAPNRRFLHSAPYGEEPDKLFRKEGRQTYTMVRDSEDFLKLNGRKTQNKVDFFEGRPEQRILRPLRTLRTALYRWKLPGATITDILKKIASIGARQPDGTREVPRYNRTGYNCACFAKDVLNAVGVPLPQTQQGRHFWRNIGWDLGGGALGGGIAVCVGALMPAVGLTAAGAGLATHGIRWLSNRTSGHFDRILPDHVIMGLLNLYKEACQRNNEPFPEFCLIAHRINPRYDLLPIEANYFYDYDFLTQTVGDALEHSVEKPERSGKFLPHQFGQADTRADIANIEEGENNE